MTPKQFDNLSKSDLPYVKDYTHASNTFVRNNMRLAPKSKFLYHVVLNVNPIALASLGLGIANILNKTEFNLLVETVDLPRYSVETDTKNAYNRKKVIQTKINHDPVGMTFHDDNAGLTTLLWEAYYRYYYQDPTYAKTDFTGLTPDTNTPYAYYDNLYKGDIYNSYKYGLDKPNRPNVSFFDTITVNHLHTQNGDSKYTSFTLVNPLITQFQHDSLGYSETGTTINTMTFAYEAVMYGRGTTYRDSPAGFANPQHYDLSPSRLSANSNNGNNTGFNNTTPSLLDTFLTIFTNELIKSTITTLTDYNSFQNQENLQTATPVTNTIGQASIGGTSSISSRSSRDALNVLTTNQKALNDFAFRNVFVNEQYANGFSGNINDMKSQWNSLSQTQKNAYTQVALNNFDTIKQTGI